MKGMAFGGAVSADGDLAFKGVFRTGAVGEDLLHAVRDEGEEMFSIVDFRAGVEGDEFLAVDFLDEVRGVEAGGGGLAGEEGLGDGAEALGGGGEEGVGGLAVSALHTADQFGEADGVIHEG